MLRLAQGHWPPAPEVIGPDATLRHTICHVYETWLRDERGLATASTDALMWEARHFLAWELDHGGSTSLIELSVRDIDLYMDTRTLGLRRKSLKDVAERLRSLLRYMYRTRHVPTDLAPHVIAPLLYAYEGVPSTLERSQIVAVLEATKNDISPMGLRDYAMLQLLATYGLRSGEIRNLLLDDIDWRAESLRVRHSKTRACSYLPLMAPVGEALLDYLRQDVLKPTGGRSLSGRVHPIVPCETYTARSAGDCLPPASNRRANADLTSSAMPERSSCCVPRFHKRSSATCSGIDRPS